MQLQALYILMLQVLGDAAGGNTGFSSGQALCPAQSII